MNLRYIISISLILLFSLSEVIGQKTFQPKATEMEWKGIIYRKMTAVEGRLHTNGAYLGMYFGKIRTYYKTNYYHFGIGYLKDPREKRQNRNISFSFPDRSKSFVFGKQNSVINIRAGVGRKRYVSEKAKRRGIAVGYDYMVGPSIALVKPYYLNLINVEDGPNGINRTLSEESYSEDNAEKFTSYNDIFGGASYWKGFGDISIVPGIQAKAGLFFSVGAFDEYVKAVELGVMADVFIKKIPIMVETDEVSNKPYFFNLYLNILLGKRRN